MEMGLLERVGKVLGRSKRLTPGQMRMHAESQDQRDKRQRRKIGARFRLSAFQEAGWSGPRARQNKAAPASLLTHKMVPVAPKRQKCIGNDPQRDGYCRYYALPGSASCRVHGGVARERTEWRCVPQTNPPRLVGAR
jgi:hypothetical protein